MNLNDIHIFYWISGRNLAIFEITKFLFKPAVKIVLASSNIFFPRIATKVSSSQVSNEFLILWLENKKYVYKFREIYNRL